MTSDLHGRKPTSTSPLKEWRPFPAPWQRKNRRKLCAGPPGSAHRKGGSREVSRLLWLLVLVHLFFFFPSHFWELRQRASERPRPQGWTATTGRLKCLDGTMDERMNERAVCRTGRSVWKRAGNFIVFFTLKLRVDFLFPLNESSLFACKNAANFSCSFQR